jgi:hypothetical protein
MRCWNCHKKLPKGAKACLFCEAPVEEEPTDEEIEAVAEVMQSMDPQLRAELIDLAQKSGTAEEFIKSIFVGSCPSCDSEDVGDCDHDPEIDDILVGRCYECGHLWCLECQRLLTKEQPHCDCYEDEEDEFEDDEFEDDEFEDEEEEDTNSP